MTNHTILRAILADLKIKIKYKNKIIHKLLLQLSLILHFNLYVKNIISIAYPKI